VANQPLAFGALLIAGIIGESAIKGKSITSVVQGTAGPLLPSSAAAVTATGGVSTIAKIGFGSSTPTPAYVAPGSPAAGETAGHRVAVVGGGSPTVLPAAVVNAYNRAVSLLGVKYVYGGGHSTASLTESVKQIADTTGLDCSALVSNVLGPDGAGVLTSVENTGGLASSPALIAGPGQYITVYDDSTGAGGLTHTFIEIAGKFFQAPQPGQDVQEMNASTVKALLTQGSFAQSHPVGM
jgi:cell wall-associated NlpC family hydrolase